MAINFPRETLDDLSVQRFQENTARAINDVQALVTKTAAEVKSSIPAATVSAFTKAVILDLNMTGAGSYLIAHNLGVTPKAVWPTYSAYSHSMADSFGNSVTSSIISLTFDSSYIHVTSSSTGAAQISFMVVV